MFQWCLLRRRFQMFHFVCVLMKLLVMGWPHSSGIIILAPLTVITRHVVDDWDVGVLQQFHACNARSRCSSISRWRHPEKHRPREVVERDDVVVAQWMGVVDLVGERVQVVGAQCSATNVGWRIRTLPMLVEESDTPTPSAASRSAASAKKKAALFSVVGQRAM